MLYRLRGILPLQDCKGGHIKEGDYLNYKNPQFKEWSDYIHQVVWSDARECYCLLCMMDENGMALANPEINAREEGRLLRIRGWQPDRWLIQNESLNPDII